MTTTDPYQLVEKTFSRYVQSPSRLSKQAVDISLQLYAFAVKIAEEHELPFSSITISVVPPFGGNYRRQHLQFKHNKWSVKLDYIKMNSWDSFGYSLVFIIDQALYLFNESKYNSYFLVTKKKKEVKLHFCSGTENIFAKNNIAFIKVVANKAIEI